MKPIMMTAVREQVADALRKAIFTGEIQAGEELTQDGVALKLGISRMPVREAFQLLERDGLIILNNHRKAVVRGISREDIRDHYEIRAVLEGEAAARCCQTNHLEELIHCQNDMEEAAQENDSAWYVEANSAFHRAMWKTSGSHRLVILLEQLWGGLPTHLPGLVDTQMLNSIQEHRKILIAIQNGAHDEARDFTQIHIRRSMQDFLDAYYRFHEGKGR